MPATDTQVYHPISALAATPLDQNMSGEARPRHTGGVSYQNRTAIDVEFLGIDAQFVAAIDHLDGIGLIQFPQIDVIDFQTMTLEQTRDRRDRADTHLVRLNAHRAEAAKDAYRI